MLAPLLAYRILRTARIRIDEIRQDVAHIREFPESGHLPVELEGFIEDNFRQALSGKSRIIYQVRDDTVFIYLVVDTRRDLQALLHRIVLRLI